MVTPISNPTAHLSPGQHQCLANARTSAIGTAKDAVTTLSQLDIAHGRIIAGMRAANRAYIETTSLPERVGDEVRQAVREQAEAAFGAVETQSRKDLSVLTARAQSIVSQLDQAASESHHIAIPADVLDGANRFLPLILSQIAGLPLPVLAKRLKSAVVRDDQSELLALSMTLSPILAGKIDSPDDPERFEAYELRDIVRQITSKWRDRSLDGAFADARRVAAKLTDLDSAIMRVYVERTDNQDPYGFLDGMR